MAHDVIWEAKYSVSLQLTSRAERINGEIYIRNYSRFQVSTWAVRWRSKLKFDVRISMFANVLSLLFPGLSVFWIDEVGIGAVEGIEKNVDDGHGC